MVNLCSIIIASNEVVGLHLVLFLCWNWPLRKGRHFLVIQVLQDCYHTHFLLFFSCTAVFIKVIVAVVSVLLVPQ